MRDSLKQTIRRGATLIQNMLIFKHLFFKTKYGKFGFIIMPAHFIMLIIMPFFFAVSATSILLILLLEPIN